MPLWLLNIGGLLKGVPWQVYAGVAILIAAYGYGCTQYDAGRESVLEELREAERKAEKKAEAARQSADAEAFERANEFEAEQETLSEVIDNAEDTGGNAIDGLFGGL